MKDLALAKWFGPSWRFARWVSEREGGARCTVCGCIPPCAYTVPFHGCRFNVTVCGSAYCRARTESPLA